MKRQLEDDMLKTDFPKKKLNCTYSHFWYVLRGEKNLSYKRAKIAAKCFDTDVDTWMDERMAAKRRDAWSQYQDGCKEG